MKADRDGVLGDAQDGVGLRLAEPFPGQEAHQLAVVGAEAFQGLRREAVDGRTDTPGRAQCVGSQAQVQARASVVAATVIRRTRRAMASSHGSAASRSGARSNRRQAMANVSDTASSASASVGMRRRA